MFYAIEPVGEEREDIRSAASRQLLYNINVAHKDRKQLKDFLLAFTEEDWAAVEKRREELNWSAAQFMLAQQRALAEVQAERGETPLVIKDL